MVEATDLSLRAQRGNPDFGAAGMPRFNRKDDTLCVFAPWREKEDTLTPRRQGAKELFS